MSKIVIAKVKSTDTMKTVAFIAVFLLALVLIIPRYVLEEPSSSKYLVAAVALAIMIAGIWAIVRIVQRTIIHGVISIDSKNLYLGRRKIAWRKIAQIYTIRKFKETYLFVTSEFVPVDKILVFEEDDDPDTPSDSLAYRINLSNFDLPPEKIEQILNEKLSQHQHVSKKS